MSEGDFFGSEQSCVVPEATSVRIQLKHTSGEIQTLRENVALQAEEMIDSSVMSASKLQEFLKAQIADAREKGVLFSLHMKATMMKVSDPIIFGHAVKAYFCDLISKHNSALETIGFNPNNGIGDLYAKLDQLPAEKQSEIEADLKITYESQPDMAMVDSDRGITKFARA